MIEHNDPNSELITTGNAFSVCEWSRSSVRLIPYNQFHTNMAHKATVEEWLQTAEDVSCNNHANE